MWTAYRLDGNFSGLATSPYWNHLDHHFSPNFWGHVFLADDFVEDLSLIISFDVFRFDPFHFCSCFLRPSIAVCSSCFVNSGFFFIFVLMIVICICLFLFFIDSFCFIFASVQFFLLRCCLFFFFDIFVIVVFFFGVETAVRFRECVCNAFSESLNFIISISHMWNEDLSSS